MSSLPEPLERAIAACVSALDDAPWDVPDAALTIAVITALGDRRRELRLIRASAQSVAPMWIDAHPDDDRPLLLIDDLEDPTAAVHGALRDALEHQIPVRDPAYTALRAIVLAHDLATARAPIVETTPLPELCAYAWLDARPELVPDARSHEPPARAEAWFRWWLAEAVPSAYRAV